MKSRQEELLNLFRIDAKDYKNSDWLEKYIESCENGNIICGHELKLEFKRIKKKWNNLNYVYSTWRADLVIEFIEKVIKLKLMLWQKAFVCALYGFWRVKEEAPGHYDENGKWIDPVYAIGLLHEQALLLVARKCGKSFFISALVTAELVLSENEEIVCSSNDATQCDILYDSVRDMCLVVDPSEEDIRKTIKNIICKHSNSKVYKLSERTKAKEGRRIAWACSDEIHELKDDTILTAISQSQSNQTSGVYIMITTEGYIFDGVLDKMLIKYRKILNEEVYETIETERLLLFLYTQDSEEEIFQDEKSWHKSNPSLMYGVKKLSYLRGKVQEAATDKIKRIQVLNKDFNWKTSAAMTWIEREDYMFDSSFDMEEFRGRNCICSCDLAETTDLSNVKILVMKNNEDNIDEKPIKYIYSHYFIPQGKFDRMNETDKKEYSEYVKRGELTILKGSSNNIREIGEWIISFFIQYELIPLLFGYDQRFANDLLSVMEENNIETELINQSSATLNNAVKRVEEEMKDHCIYLNNNTLDFKCFANAGLKVSSDSGNVLIVRQKNDPRMKIDGAVNTAILFETLARKEYEFNLANGNY